MRILVGTLYTVENEFQQCLAALTNQSYTNFDHVIIPGLTNREAHDTLYRTFIDHAGDFQIFLKLDADMVFASRDSLGEVVHLFDTNPGLDHLQAVVHDWYSDSLLMGVHAFSSRAHWRLEDALFVDPKPEIPGQRCELWSLPAPFVIHSPDPSPFEAFRFGAHRATKVVQRSGSHFRPTQATLQWQVLTNTWDHFRRTGDRRLGLAVMGAELVLKREINHTDYSTTAGERLAELYRRYESLTADELYVQLKPAWQAGLLRDFRYRSVTAPRLLATVFRWPAERLLKRRSARPQHPA